MRNNLLRALAALCLLAPASRAALAADAPERVASPAPERASSAPERAVPSTEATAASLTRLGEEIAVMKARYQQLEWEVRLATKRTELQQLVRGTGPANAGGGTAATVPDAPPPLVRAIEGVGAVNHATLQMADGATLDAVAGAVLPNGMQVLSVGTSFVVVQDAKKRRFELTVTPPPPRAAQAAAPAPAANGGPLPSGFPGFVPAPARATAAK